VTQEWSIDVPGLPDEHDAARKPTRHWIGVVDGARSLHGQDGIHEPGLEGAYEIRSDRLGLGHIGEVPVGKGRAGIEAGGGDSW